MTDAIVRTLFRLFVSRRRLLEWVTAAQAKLNCRLDLRGSFLRLAGGVALAAVAAVLVVWIGNGPRLIAAPFVILWLLSPAGAWWASRPPPPAGLKPVTAADAQALRLIARRTWRFFETFVTAQHNMLPPDNFQEVPKPVVAHRTSPTNLGPYFFRGRRRDFGWLSMLDTVERLEVTLETMNWLERFRGHFYNWYDTQDFRPFDLKYVFSVDSGNLAGHLIALANACRELINRPVVGPEWLAGITDTLELTRESLRGLSDDRRTQTVTRKQLDEALNTLAALLQPVHITPTGVAAWLVEITRQADTVTDMARTLTEERGENFDAEVLTWAEALRASCKNHERYVELLMPWACLIVGDTPLAAVPTRAGTDLLTSPEEELGLFLDSIPNLADLPDRCEAAIGILARRRAELAAQTDRSSDSLGRADVLIDALERSAQAARSLERRLAALAERAGKIFAEMEFDFLFDTGRQLLAIGYRVADGSLDPSCYDLLASEARLASFVAIAKGDVPVRHWFRLGRALTPVDHGSALISWSGSMFEYLMPLLVMREPVGSVLEQTSRLVVHRQRKYGAELGVPWGVSESAYNVKDFELTYQYSNFGVPGLGLKRGLSEDAVIAPYATALAAMLDAEAAAKNFSRLTEAGARGRYGWYEALDYTGTRLPEGEPVAIVRAFMAHHQG
jgi:cyclic beta-1,2-glucan synthetase